MSDGATRLRRTIEEREAIRAERDRLRTERDAYAAVLEVTPGNVERLVEHLDNDGSHGHIISSGAAIHILAALRAQVAVALATATPSRGTSPTPASPGAPGVLVGAEETGEQREKRRGDWLSGAYDDEHKRLKRAEGRGGVYWMRLQQIPHRECLLHAAEVATEAGEGITDGKAGIEAAKDGGAYYVAALLRSLANTAPSAEHPEQGHPGPEGGVLVGSGTKREGG